MRTARSRISGENFGDFLILAPFSSEGASAKPGAVQIHENACYTLTNLTISLDENTVRKARLRAIEEGTSVSAKVREFLARYARGENGDAADSAAGAVKLPVFNGGQGLEPALDPLSNKSLRAAAEEDA